MNSAGSGDAPIASKEKFKSSLPKPKSFIPSYKKLTIYGKGEKFAEKCINTSIKTLRETKNEPEEDSWKSKIGHRVCLSGVKHGTLLFYGKTDFAEGYWCGISLDEPVGKNDGEKDGVKYFSCPKNHGIFAPPFKVSFVDSPDERQATLEGIDSKELVSGEKHTELISNTVSTENELVKPFDSKIVFSTNEKGKNIQINEKNRLESRIKPPKIPRKNRGIPVFSSKQNILQSNIEETHSKLSANDDINLNTTHVVRDLVSSPHFTVTRSKLTCDSSLNQTVLKESKSETCLEIENTNTFVHSGKGDDGGDNYYIQENDAEITYINPCRDSSVSTFVLNSSLEDQDIINSTYLLKTEPKNISDSCPLNKTYQIDSIKPHLNKTFDFLENFESDTITEEEMPDRIKLENQIALNLAANIVDCHGAFQDDYDSEDVDGYGRQGSFEFDESLGILTPNQMKDFTLFAESCLMKTPSVEDVRELDDEVVDDFCQDLPSKEENDVEYKNSSNLKESFVTKTSTPFPDYKYLSPLEKGILDIPYPTVTDSISYLHLTQFEKTKLSSNEMPNLPDFSRVSENDVEYPLPFNNENHFDKSSEIHNSVLNRDTSDKIIEPELCILNTKTRLSEKEIPPEILEQHLNLEEEGRTNELQNQLKDFIALKKDISDDDRIYHHKANEKHIIDVVEKLLQGVMSESMNEVYSTCITSDKNSTKSSQQLPQYHTGKEEVITDYLVQQIGQNFNEHILEKKDRPFSSLTVSVTSIDTGYQGDAEGDVPSATASALNTPVEEQRKMLGASDNFGNYLNDAVCILRHPKVDVGSDSDFCSDMGTSWTESEVENEEKVRGRSARVIDGKLYYNIDEMEQLTIDVEKQKIGELEQGGDVSLEAKCELNEDTSYKVIDLSQTAIEQITVLENSVSSESSATLDAVSAENSNDKVVDQDAQILSNEKEIKSVDNEGNSDVLTPSKQITAETEEQQHKNDPQEKSDVAKIKSTGKSPQSHGLNSSQSSGPDTSKKSLKKEDNNNSTIKKFKQPKKNVVSKIKAMIESSSVKSTPSPEEKMDQIKKTRLPKKSRWDAVMSRIAAGQAEEKAKAKTKREIKSRVDTNLSGSKTVVKSPFEKRLNNKSNHSFTRERTASSDFASSGIDGEPGSNHSSRSDLSVSQLSGSKAHSKSKLPRRPSTQKSERPVSPSQLSDVSTLSAASHLSVESQMSQMSCALNKSNASLNSTSSANKTKDTSIHRPKPAALKQNIKSTARRQPLSSTPIQSAGNKKSQPTLGNNTHHVINNKSPVKAATNQRVTKTTLQPRVSVSQALPSSNKLTKEQVRLRNVKNQPTVSKPNLQTEASKSTSFTRIDLSKEKARLETLCENHLKEKHLMKTYIEQKNRDLEALAMVLRYMNEELNAFSLPSLQLKLEHLNDELHKSRNSLDQADQDKKDLHTQITNLTSSHEESVKKLEESHAKALEDLRESLQKINAEEIQKLTDNFKCLEEERQNAFKNELEELKLQHENHKKQTEEQNKQQLLELEMKHTSELEDLKKRFADELKEEEEKMKSIQTELKEKISRLTTHNEELKRKNKEIEENLLKDSDFKMQMAASKIKDLEKEVDSLKTVMELRNKEIHELRQDSNLLKKLKEELHVAEEKITVLTARTEDLQAQINIKSTTERQLSSEHQLLKEWYEKKSKMNKRLSMENEELQWRLQQSLEGSFFLFNGSPDYHSWDENVKKMTENSDTPRRHYLDPSAAASPSSGTSSSPKFPNKSNPVQIRDAHGRCHQRLSVSDIEPKPRSDLSPAVRYRRTGSLSWTVGIDPNEPSPNASSGFVFKSRGSPDSTKESTETLDECKTYSSDSELKLAEKEDSSVFATSDVFRLSSINLSEMDGAEKQNVMYDSSFDIGTESEPYVFDGKENIVLFHRKEMHSPSSSPSITEDNRVPSLITIKKLKDDHEDRPKSAESSKTPIKMKHKSQKHSSPVVISKKTMKAENHINGAIIGSSLSANVKENAAVISDKLTAADDDQESLNEPVKDQLSCEIVPVLSVVDNGESLLSQFPSVETDDTKNTNGCELHKNNDIKNSMLNTGNVPSTVEFDFSNDELYDSCALNKETDSKSVASHTRSSMVDAIELDYTARCLTNLEESQHSSVTDSNILEETISESHNSSDFEIISETEETTNTRLSSPKWDSISDIEHSPVHSKRSDKSSGHLNSTTVIGIKSPTDSSPLQEQLEMSNSSESNSSSSESSPRDSPLFKLRDDRVESMEDSPCSFAMSPRTSAGEAMVLVALPSPHHDQMRESSNTLLRRTLHDQFIHDNALNCTDTGGKDSSSEETSQIFFSKPATPESSSQAVAPTDSTNIDLSWSDDDDDGIPSESEV